jgi:hypothetical protein
MKKSIVWLFFITAACKPGDKIIPKDILPVDTMKVIVWDLTQAGAYTSYLKDTDTTNKKINTAYLAEALKLYKISKDDFFKSFNFYQAHPVLNKELFDSVYAYAQRQRNEMYKRLR